MTDTPKHHIADSLSINQLKTIKRALLFRELHLDKQIKEHDRQEDKDELNEVELLSINLREAEHIKFERIISLNK